jgi:hypothetical protein
VESLRAGTRRRTAAVSMTATSILRVRIETGFNAADPPVQTYGRDTIDPADQTSHHAFQRLTQHTLHNKFHNHNDY